MIRTTITVFDHTFEAAKQVRDAINASVPGAAVTVEQVLSDAAAKGINDYLKVWRIGNFAEPLRKDDEEDLDRYRSLTRECCCMGPSKGETLCPCDLDRQRGYR